MTRKRIEAWAVVGKESLDLFETRADAENLVGPGDRLVRLVEYDAAKEAVVRAAVAYVNGITNFDMPVALSAFRRFHNVVEQYQKGKR